MSLPALALNYQELLPLLHWCAILQFSIILSPSAVSFPSQKVPGIAACVPIEASPGNSTPFCMFFSSQKGTL